MLAIVFIFFFLSKLGYVYLFNCQKADDKIVVCKFSKNVKSKPKNKRLVSRSKILPYMRYRVFDVHFLRFYADSYIFTLIEYPITLRKIENQKKK